MKNRSRSATVDGSGQGTSWQEYECSFISLETLAGLPLTSRLRKSQTSYPSNLEVPQENLGSPTFFRAAAVCPFFRRTEVLNSVSHRIIMIYTSLRCVLNMSLSLIKIRSHLFGKPVLVCRTLERKHQHWYNFAFVSKPREWKKKRKYMRENTQNMFS